MDDPTGGSPTGPQVTVILPAFERPATTRVAIASALGQRYEDFVLVVGDDSRSDAVEEVVRSFDDARIRYHRNATQLGAKGNWIDLLRRAETPFVASLNDDDEWTPELLERLVPPLLEHPEVVVSFGDFVLVDKDGRTLPELTAELSQRTRRDRIPRGVVGRDRAEGVRLVAAWNAPQPAICAVLRADAVRDIEFPDEVTSIHDLWLSYQVVMRGGAFHYSPEQLARYRWHEDSLTQTRGFSDEEDHVFGRIVAENLDHPAAVEEVRRYWAFIRWGRAVRAMAHPDGEAVSRRELAAAAPHLRWHQQLVARVASRSSIAWRAAAALRRLRRRDT